MSSYGLDEHTADRLPVQSSCSQLRVFYRSQQMQGMCELPALLDAFVPLGEKVDLKLQRGAASSKHAPRIWALGQSLGTNACKETTYHFIIDPSFQQKELKTSSKLAQKLPRLSETDKQDKVFKIQVLGNSGLLSLHYLKIPKEVLDLVLSNKIQNACTMFLATA